MRRDEVVRVNVVMDVEEEKGGPNASEVRIRKGGSLALSSFLDNTGFFAMAGFQNDALLLKYQPKSPLKKRLSQDI